VKGSWIHEPPRNSLSVKCPRKSIPFTFLADGKLQRCLRVGEQPPGETPRVSVARFSIARVSVARVSVSVARISVSRDSTSFPWDAFLANADGGEYRRGPPLAASNWCAEWIHGWAGDQTALVLSRDTCDAAACEGRLCCVGDWFGG